MLENLPVSVVAVPSQFVYANISGATLQSLVEHIFPDWLVHSSYGEAYGVVDALNPGQLSSLGTKNSINILNHSSVGNLHRWKLRGHDLGLDIPKILATKGPVEALRQTGHILLTDFVTKAGIPIPFFSEAGLGGILTKYGVDPRWLNVSLFDTGIGIFAINNASSTLAAAISGALQMNSSVFLNTFGEGSIEIALSMASKNPLLLAGGLENITAGIVSAWKTFTYYVPATKILGSSLGTAAIGYVISRFLMKKDIQTSFKEAVKSGAVGGLFSISPSFGLAAMAGLFAYQIGEQMGKDTNEKVAELLKVTDESYTIFLEELEFLAPGAIEMLAIDKKSFCLESDTSILTSDNTMLSSNNEMLTSDTSMLPSDESLLPSDNFMLESDNSMLPSDNFMFESDSFMLSSDETLLYSDMQSLI